MGRVSETADGLQDGAGRELEGDIKQSSPDNTHWSLKTSTEAVDAAPWRPAQQCENGKRPAVAKIPV